MEEIQEYLPENLFWVEEKGIVQGKGEKEKRVANAVPIVKKRISFEQPAAGIARKVVVIQYLDCNNTWVGELQEMEEADIMNGNFMRSLPIEVQADNKRIAKATFLKMIQGQAAKKLVEKVKQYPFGWYEKEFHLGEERREILQGQEYRAAIHVADIITQRNQAVTALVLAAVHGPMKHILEAAEIGHDFVTFLAGPTGIGKTALAKKICGYLNKPIVLALSSERKNLRKTIQKLTDVTIVVDDFNTSASDRMVSRQLQIVSEIIQGECDAGDVVLDETSAGKRNHNTHLVITSESIICNVSTMNRCFLVNMQEAVSDYLWEKISGMDKQQDFSIFMQSFLGYIGKNYDTAVQGCREDFKYYKQHAKKQISSNGTSANRVAETLAVQYVLKKQMINYFKTVGLDDKLCLKVDICIDKGIAGSGQELQQELNKMVSKEEYMEFLPILYLIVKPETGYKMAKSEKLYLKTIKKGKDLAGFQHVKGYVSFRPSHMCSLIAKMLDIDTVSVSALGKELSHYHLAHVDGSEQKQSCRWHTEGKYYHVHIQQLIELIEGECKDIDSMIEYVEDGEQWSY